MQTRNDQIRPDPRIVQMIADKADLPVTSLPMDSTLEQIGLDSLSLMEMALKLQEQYGAVVEEGEVQLDHTVAETLDQLSRKLG